MALERRGGRRDFVVPYYEISRAPKGPQGNNKTALHERAGGASLLVLPTVCLPVATYLITASIAEERRFKVQWGGEQGKASATHSEL